MEITPTGNTYSRKINLPEVHLTDVVLFFKRHFLFLAIATGLGGVLGLLISYSFEKIYTASTTLLPEYSAARPSFFSMAVGGGSGDGTGPLTPELYPSILKTTSFGEHLLELPIVAGDGTKYKTLKDYLLRPTTPSLLSRLTGTSSTDKTADSEKNPLLVIPEKNILNFSREEEGIINTAKGLASALIEQKNGVITIQSEMNDPVVAAQIVEYSKNYLTTYIENFRVAKLIKQQEFLSTRVNEAKKRQQSAEFALQSYRDHNRGSFLNVARIEEQRLQSDFTLAQSIYNDLIIKLEQTRIKVKEERPVFNVLEPTKVPLDKTSPRRILIAGIVAGVAFVLSLIFILFFKEKVHLFFVNPTHPVTELS